MQMTEDKVKYIKLNGIDVIKKFNSLSTYERCSMLTPWLKDINGMETFLNKHVHLKFEKYDIENDTDGFEAMFEKGYLECMITHRKLTVFEWNNFDKWLEIKRKPLTDQAGLIIYNGYTPGDK